MIQQQAHSDTFRSVSPKEASGLKEKIDKVQSEINWINLEAIDSPPFFIRVSDNANSVDAARYHWELS